MRIAEYKDGNMVYRDATPEEITMMESKHTENPEPEPTPEERLCKVEKRTADLESGNAEILEALDMLLSGVTE